MLGHWYDMTTDNDRHQTELWLTWKQWAWNNALENFDAYGAAKHLPVDVQLQKRIDRESPAESLQLSILR